MGAVIVLADDDPDLRSIYAALLRSEGFEVYEACDGSSAIAEVVGHHPALLLLDVWMPVLNGFEVLQHLRNDPVGATTKTVILSNLGDSDSRLEGFAEGVVDYWVKGLSLPEFLERVHQVLAAAEPVPERP